VKNSAERVRGTRPESARCWLWAALAAIGSIVASGAARLALEEKLGSFNVTSAAATRASASGSLELDLLLAKGDHGVYPRCAVSR
jgi:hypothetical protein